MCKIKVKNKLDIWLPKHDDCILSIKFKLSFENDLENNGKYQVKHWYA